MDGEAKFWLWIAGMFVALFITGQIIDALTQKSFVRSCIDNGGYVVIKKHDTPICREQAEKTP